MFKKLIKDSFIWFPEKKIGYFPVVGNKYNEEYFRNYQKYADSPMGERLTKSRVDLVLNYYGGTILDFGIGSGQFIDKYGDAFGYDINPVAVKWLKDRGLYKNPYEEPVHCASFWDSLEHVECPDEIIAKIKKFVFISIPIFHDHKSIINSKHFKKDEHYWYFTHNGLVNWFLENGFECIEHNNMETDLGRESIGSYVFKRYIN